MSADSVVARRREKHVAEAMHRCKHFTGIQHGTCAVGVSYDLARAKAPTGGLGIRLACFDEAETPICPRRELPTRAEAEAQEDAHERRLQEFLGKMAIGVCQCGVESTDWVQEGRCIYAKPCGHRVGQGDAKGYKAGVLKARAEKRSAP